MSVKSPVLSIPPQVKLPQAVGDRGPWRRSHCGLHCSAAADAVAKALANNTTLETLDISCNNIACAAAVRIAAGLAANSHLRRLDASGNPITASGAAALLEPLIFSPALEVVDVLHCTLSDGVADARTIATVGAGTGVAAASQMPAPDRVPSQPPETTQPLVFTTPAPVVAANSGTVEVGQRSLEGAAGRRVDPRVAPNFMRRVPAAPAGAPVLSDARFAALWERLDLAAASRGWVLQYAAAAARALWLQPKQCAAMVAGLLLHHEGPHADAVAAAVRPPKSQGVCRFLATRCRDGLYTHLKI